MFAAHLGDHMQRGCDNQIRSTSGDDRDSAVGLMTRKASLTSVLTTTVIARSVVVPNVYALVVCRTTTVIARSVVVLNLLHL